MCNVSRCIKTNLKKGCQRRRWHFLENWSKSSSKSGIGNGLAKFEVQNFRFGCKRQIRSNLRTFNYLIYLTDTKKMFSWCTGILYDEVFKRNGLFGNKRMPIEHGKRTIFQTRFCGHGVKKGRRFNNNFQ